MNNNLPEKSKTSFFSKFINKVKMFFFRTKEKYVIINEKTFEEEQCNKNDFATSLQVATTDISIKYEQKTFIDKLTKQPQLLENFSNDRLEKILQYYLEENEKKREVLKKILGT